MPMNELKRKAGNSSFLILLLFLFCGRASFAQQGIPEFNILFYNVENLFDMQDNPETDDDSFTPKGDFRWSNKRFSTKILNISKVILNASGWQIPDIIILCEIENRFVVEQLISQTPLQAYPLNIIHKESPDHRGTDVAMVYNPQTFAPVEYAYYPVPEGDSTMKTREILYVCGIVNETDTLHIFGNHWPSRYSGLLETKGSRKVAAKLLRSKVDELMQKYGSPKVVITGDFNDNPEDESLALVLQAQKVDYPIDKKGLYNLFFDFNRVSQGSLKYQWQWYVFDQIIVSGMLLESKTGLYVIPENAKILSFPFLMENDKKFGGQKPFRTFYGFSYTGGFSDHLPVLLKLNQAN